MAPRVNINSVLGWAVATGRIHWSKERELREAYEDDPVRVLGNLLVAKPKAGKERSCPLFTKNATTSRAAQRTWAERKARDAAAAETVSTAISATLRELGHDPEDPALRAMVKAEIDKAEAARKRAAKTAARVAARQQQKLEQDAPLAAQFIKHWKD